MLEYLPVNPNYNPNPAPNPNPYGPFAAFRAKHPYDDRTDDELRSEFWDNDED